MAAMHKCIRNSTRTMIQTKNIADWIKKIKIKLLTCIAKKRHVSKSILHVLIFSLAADAHQRSFVYLEAVEEHEEFLENSNHFDRCVAFLGGTSLHQKARGVAIIMGPHMFSQCFMKLAELPTKRPNTKKWLAFFLKIFTSDLHKPPPDFSWIFQASDRMLRILRSWTHCSNGYHHGFLAAKAIGKHSRQEALSVGRLTFNDGKKNGSVVNPKKRHMHPS